MEALRAATIASVVAHQTRVDARRKARGQTCRRACVVTYSSTPPSDPDAVVMKPWTEQQQDDADHLTRIVLEQCDKRGLTFRPGFGGREFSGVGQSRAFGFVARVCRTEGGRKVERTLGVYPTAEIAAAHVADFNEKNPPKLDMLQLRRDLWTEDKDDALKAAYARLTVQPATMPHAMPAQPAAPRSALQQNPATTDVPQFQFASMAPAALAAPFVSMHAEGDAHEVLVASRERVFASIADIRGSAFASIARSMRLTAKQCSVRYHELLGHASSVGAWSAGELSRLDCLVAAHTGERPISWDTLAQMFPGRVPSEIAPTQIGEKRRNRLASVRAPRHPAAHAAHSAHPQCPRPSSPRR